MCSLDARYIVSKYARLTYPSLISATVSLHRVERDESWSLFCPSEAEALLRSSGAQFNRYLLGYEALKIGVVYQARDIWSAIIGKAIEPNGPRLMFTDTVNRE